MLDLVVSWHKTWKIAGLVVLHVSVLLNKGVL